MKLRLFIFLLLFSVFVNAQELKPQWGPFGVVVGDALGNALQQDPRAVKSSGNSTIIVFSDNRLGNLNIYAQKIDETGNNLFPLDGIGICQAPGDQNAAKAVSDGAGGAIIVWTDNRNGIFNIYAQRIDETGKCLWRENGIPLSPAQGGQYFPEIISDSMGGAIIAWHDYKSGDENIIAQRIDGQGRLLFSSQGVEVCAAAGTQWFPKLVSDGSSGAIIVWMDRRYGNFDIYAQRIDYSGKIMWEKDGVAVCSTLGNQENIAVKEADGIYIAWRDTRFEAPGIYLQKINNDGTMAFQNKGILLSSNSETAGPPEINITKDNNIVIAWSDKRAGDFDVYMQCVGPKGNLLWGNSALPLAKLKGAQENVRLFNGSTYLFAVWEDKRKGQLYGQKFDKNGNLLYGPEGIQISIDGKDPIIGDAVFLAEDKMLLSYADKKKGNYDIYCANILKTGAIAWTNVLNDTPGEAVQKNFAAVYSKGGAIFAYEDYRSGSSNIYLQKISDSGKAIWAKDGIPAALMQTGQKNPQLAADGAGGVIAAWEEENNSNNKIYAQKINAQGDVVWGSEGIDILPQMPNCECSKIKIVSDGYGGAIVVFVVNRRTSSYADIYAQRISADGQLLWGGDGKVVSAGNGNQDSPTIAPRSLVVAWTDYRNGDRNPDIFAQRITLNGDVLWAQDGVPVCDAPEAQRDPIVSDNFIGGTYIAWADKAGGSFDIYFQRLDQYGQQVFKKDGIPVCQASRTQQLLNLLVLPNNEAVCVWEDFRMGNWDIFCQKINVNGQPVFGAEGFAVAQENGTQYFPSSVQISGNTLVAWEDYRSGKNYNIYIQGVSSDGENIFRAGGEAIKETKFGARYPKLIAAGNQSMILGWEDHRFGRRGIFAQKFSF
ncbi:MAG: 5'-nucleotidase [Candidatus Saganbacteria bacterium]|uniref:5'-nucleotidase n=1 Tax=Candidatus Saganbacteria bacterium TaxID=2575572 RepID=A0A833NRE4_UNCSA|nr:MAG: 5'-nucleotidase [Candidatus Saganbacteria bacterium]